MKTFSATKLTILACPCVPTSLDSYERLEDKSYETEAWLFENGSILVPGESTNDWFFDSIDDYVPNGEDEIIEIKIEADTTSIWTDDELAISIEGSEQEFECSAGKIKELLS